MKAEDCTTNTFQQDFEDPAEHRRWRRKYGDRSPGRHKICHAAARTGEYGLRLLGQVTIGCWGVRGATLRRSNATKLRLAIRAIDKPCPMPTVELLAELPNGDRCQWRWANPPAGPLGTEWKTIDVPFGELEAVGTEPVPVEMLSSGLGQLRLLATEETNVYVDDVEAL